MRAVPATSRKKRIAGVVTGKAPRAAKKGAGRTIDRSEDVMFGRTKMTKTVNIVTTTAK
jgi:hypothetical protein